MVAGIHDDDLRRARRGGWGRRRGGLARFGRSVGVCRRGAAAGNFGHTTVVIGSLLEGAPAKLNGSNLRKGHVGERIIIVYGNGSLEQAHLALVVEPVVDGDFP